MCDLMYSCRGLDTMRESMPQTVPSAGFTPPSEYLHFAADYFDLSLLPSSPDLDLPPSPFSLHQGMSFYGDPANSPPSSLFGAQSQTQDDFKNQQQDLQRPPVTVSNFHFVMPPSTSTVIKEEPQTYRDSSCGFSSSGSPYPSMGQMTSPIPPSPYEHMSHVSAPSPMPSSPAGSTSSSSTSYQRCPTPHSIKHEQTIDLAHILSEHQVLQENIKEEGLRSQPKDRPSTSGRTQEIPSGSMYECSTQVGGNGHLQQHKPYADESAGSGSDHKLLREFLRDPSFQKKYNLRPFEFAGLGSGFVVAEAGAGSSAVTEEKLEGEDLQLSREKMEPVLRLAIQQLRKDVGDTCTQLGIAPDPTRWSSRDVEAWILWALHHYALPMINMEYFDMDGSALSALSEQDFQQRAPLCGSTLYAHLEIWKAACQDLDAGTSATWNSSTSNSSTGDSSDDEDDETESAASASPSVGTTSGGKMLSNRSSGGGGSHIHLWQFLKELLASPQLHGSCIRWLDRSKGVFKIEDSVRVARLWGKRKNRPAMNYDKLSRSIRQYYKKGIMKKTERSQRLVYQFCHPYCL